MRFAFLSAILGILAFSPFNFYPLALFFLAPLFVFLAKEKKLWRLVAGIFVFRTVFLLGTAYFTFEPFTWLFSILIFLGLPISVFLIKNGLKRISNSLFIIHYSLFILLLPLLWLFWEFVNAEYFFLPSYLVNSSVALGASPFLGLAVFGGQFSLSLFALAANALLAAGVSDFLKKENNWKRYFAVFLIIIIVGAAISNYSLKINARNYESLNGVLKIAAISSGEKFNLYDFESLKKELNKAVASDKIDFLFFPEDILNIQSPELETAITKELAKNLNINLVSVFDTFQNGKKYNSAVLFGKNGDIAGVYSKKYLTFIGEYWPFGNWRPTYFDRIRKNNPQFENYAVFKPENRYSRGEEKIMEITPENGGKTAKFASLICLEIQYPLYARLNKNLGADFIINPSSNRWLGSDANHYLYLNNNLRKITAVWLKMPVILSGVEDFAGIIEPDGEIKTAFYGEPQRENSEKNYAGQIKNYAVFWGEIKY